MNRSQSGSITTWMIAALSLLGAGAAAYVVLSATAKPSTEDGRFTRDDLAEVRIPVFDKPAKPLELPEPGAAVALPVSPILTAERTEAALTDYKGRVVLVNLWADWCPPCLAEMPSLNNLEATLGSEDFAVVPVSLSTSLEDGVAYYEKAELEHLPFYHDESFANVARELQVRNAMPVTVLFDRTGTEVARAVGDAIWDSPEAQALINGVVSTREPLR